MVYFFGRILGVRGGILGIQNGINLGGDFLRVYILENHSIKIQNMLSWLAEKSNIEEISLIKNEALFLELAERDPPDVAFIRLGDEEIPGLTIGNKLYQMGNKTDIVYISDDRNQALNAYEVGAAGYLLGPVKKSKLEKCLNNLQNK